MESAGIVIAAVKQHALLSARFPIAEPPHHGGACIDVVPSANIGEREELHTQRR